MGVALSTLFLAACSSSSGNDDGEVETNAAPMAQDQSVTLDQDTTANVTLGYTDADGPGPYTFTIVQGPANGTLGGDDGDAAVAYTPAAGYSGPDSFTFRVNDGLDDSDIATVSLTVVAVATNTAPTAQDQSVILNQDMTANVTLGYTDPDGPGPYAFTIVQGPANGSLGGDDGDAAVTYTPAASYSGPDNFTFRVNDGLDDSDIATVRLTVEAVATNTAPTAHDQSVTLDQDTTANITLGYTDSDGPGPYTFTIVQGPADGTLGDDDGDASVTYTPSAGHSGPDTFTFRVNDGLDDSTVATVSLTVEETSTEPPPTISIADATVTEVNSGTVALIFDVNLSAAADEDVVVEYATAEGTAEAGSDFEAVADTLTITAGATSGSINVTVQGDTLYEPDENFTMTLSAPVNATLGTATATGTIENDDAVPAISISDAQATEGDSGTTQLTFDVTVSTASGVEATAEYTTSDGSAASGSDYTAASGTVSFPPGNTSQTIVVDVLGDSSEEDDETLTITLSNPADASLTTTTATGTIIDDDDSVTVGLDSRPQNLTCVAPPRPETGTNVALDDAYPNLPNISQPTKMLLEPVADPRWFVLRKSGQVVTVDPDNATVVSTYIDRSGVVRTTSEAGMLGLAFHPDYPATPEIFLSYTVNHSGPVTRSVISRLILDDVVTPGAGTVEQVILEVDQDFDNHNGGDIAFGADGYLYIGLGDGGGGGDPNNRAQDTTRLLGSMLRIDVLGSGVTHPGNPYDIPPDNPFAGNAECGPSGNADDCPEIYAWGLRNPWRWSFDPPTGDMWVADVGQNAWEEVNLVELGGNYGWRCREGTHDYNTSGCGTGLIDPVAEYSHTLGNSITGGFVYRGSALPDLEGRYIFADYGSGRFWALQSDGQGGYTNEEIAQNDNYGATAFGVGPDGELYFTDINTSRLRKLVPDTSSANDTIPDSLADTGCTDPSDVTQPYGGLLPYDLNAPFWSDGAAKERYLGLPDGTVITREADDDWSFPAGTVIVKNFRLDGNLVETRQLMRHPDGTWAGYTYEWNALQTAAARVRGGKTVAIGGQDYIFPSEAQCMECHTNAAGFALGPETAQLNRDFTYPSTQRTANQLETLDHIMMFASPLPGPASGLPMLTEPDDMGAALGDRARAYLHTNCAQCHRPNGPTPSTMGLRYTTSLADTNACDAPPLEGDLGIANARLIAPGDASRSLVIERATRRDSHGMPPVGSNLVDTDGVTLLTNWIEGLAGCN